jgi:outer membrane immunogenic protein
LFLSFAPVGHAGDLKAYRELGSGSAWSGPYVGVHYGGGWGDIDWSYPSGDGTSPGVDAGALFGAQLGLQHAWNGFVAGVDVSYSGTVDVGERSWCPNLVNVCSNKLGNLLLVNGRLGYALGPTMLYAAGGYARSSVDIHTRFPNPALNESAKERVGGWAIGGGLEYMPNSKILIGFEYLRVDFNNEDFALRRDINGTFAERVKVDADFNLVRTRLTVRLGSN